MTTQTAAYEALSDPLSSASRASRRSIFVFAIIALLIVKAQKGPNEISILGLKFPDITDQNINLGIIALLLFSLVTFFISGLSDFFRYRHKLDAYKLAKASDVSEAINTRPDSYRDAEEDMRQQEFQGQTGYKPTEIPEKTSSCLLTARTYIDFYIPLLTGVGVLIFFLIKRF